MKLALIGDPVDHSRSPALQLGFLALAGRAGSYEALQVRAGEGAARIAALRSAGYFGLNVTTPLKEEAFACSAGHDDAATRSGSVNTLVLGADVAGYDTDGIGALGVLRDAGLGPVAGARVLVLGAGPTARSAVAALIASGARVWLWNRTLTRGRAAARRLGALPFAREIDYDAVFATLPPHAVPADAEVCRATARARLLVDANYGSRATLAGALGRSGTDGAGMLEHSARASFAIWCAAWDGRRVA